jgi:putative tryptophan/tyrosine transport system substrate-binding protein
MKPLLPQHSRYDYVPLTERKPLKWPNGKRLALIKDMFPRTTRMAILSNPQHPGEQRELKVAQDTAPKLGIALRYFPVRAEPELEAALAEIAASRLDAMSVFSDGFAVGQASRIAAFSIQNRIPVVAGWATFAERGNLVTYGPVFTDVYRRVAFYVDQIGKGAKPGGLPIEQPTKLELVINMTTAKALGADIPKEILLRADRLIE